MIALTYLGAITPLQSSTLTLSATVPASALLVVGVENSNYANPATAPTATYNGQAMTSAGTIQNTNNYFRATVFYYLNPTLATANIVASVGSVTYPGSMHAVYFTGHRSPNPIPQVKTIYDPATAVTSYSSTFTSAPISAESRPIVFAGMYNSASTPRAGWTELADTVSTFGLHSQWQPNAWDSTFSATFSAGSYGVVALEIAGDSGSTAQSGMAML